LRRAHAVVVGVVVDLDVEVLECLEKGLVIESVDGRFLPPRVGVDGGEGGEEGDDDEGNEGQPENRA